MGLTREKSQHVIWFLESRKTSSVKQTESHVIILLGLWLRLLGCSGSGSSLSSSGGGSSSELAGVSQELLQSLSLLEGDVRHSGHGEKILHAVDDAVGNRGNCWVVDGEANSSNIGNTGHEPVLYVIVSDVQDLGVEDRSVVIDLLDEEPVGEGRDLQHVQESGLGGSHPVSHSDDGHVLDDLNCSL